MVICKFFMEGYCKFGQSCKFEHISPYRGYDSPRSLDYAPERPQGTSILKAPTTSFGHSQQLGFSNVPQHQSFDQISQHGFSTPQQTGFAQKPSGLKYNVQEVMAIVMRDIAQLEKGGQWQLSCYSPLKELPNMPGLEDHSPDELRWECYKALQNGSLPLCQAIVQQLFANVAKINNDLRRKDTGYSIIDRWLRDSEARVVQNTTVQQQSAFSPFVGSSAANSHPTFNSPFFSPSEAQPQPLYQTTASSFTFSLPAQQTSPVQSLQPSATVFPTTQMTVAFPSQRGSVFSSPATAPVINDQVYSATDELSETELKAFQADRFVLGSIPTKPPPNVLCNL